MLRLVLAEKPSTAKSISAVLGADKRGDGFFHENSYIVTWCLGHLIEFAPADLYNEKYTRWDYGDLPIIPGEWKFTVSKDKVERLKVISGLMARLDVDEVINACDAGREGELIFRLVYNYCKCDKPVKRLWISSMEEKAVKEGFQNLKAGSEYDNLYQSAFCRAKADWLVGINATRTFSCIYGGSTLNVGRVQSPTLAMLVRREADISAFVKEPFYTPVLDLSGFTVSGEKLKDRAEADRIAAACAGQTAVVTAVERVRKTAAPPKLYDLTALQREANRLLGFTAQQTLDYVQSLYEKKLASYPRTDARFITADMRGTALKILGGDTNFVPNIDRIVGAVGDHHAIIPTIESVSVDRTALPSGERGVFELIRKRLVSAVSPVHVYEAVKITLDCGGNIFTAKGKTVIEAGWRTQDDDSADSMDSTDNTDSDDNSGALPEVSDGQIFGGVTARVKEGATAPPKHYTEDSLLLAMETAGAEDIPENSERKGLGTPATRAATIEKIIKSGFAERYGKNIIPTEKGKNLIAVLPETLTSAKLTAEWEYKLEQTQRGEIDGDTFTGGIAEFTKSVVAENAAPKEEYLSLFPKSEKRSAPPLGVCPRCGNPVREGQKGYFCDSRDCGFKLWKNSKFWTAKKKPLSPEIVAVLLKDGRVSLKGLYSEKTGKEYSATVILDDTNDGNSFVNFKMEFNARK